MRSFSWNSWVALAFVGAAAGAATFGWALRKAMTATSVSITEAPLTPAAWSRVTRAEVPSRDYLGVAVASAPFDPQRRPPLSAFRMPGEMEVAPPVGPPAPPATPAPEPASSLVLRGTMVIPDGKPVALVERAGQQARLLRVGDSIGDQKLRSISRGTAVFVGPDGRSTKIAIPKLGT